MISGLCMSALVAEQAVQKAPVLPVIIFVNLLSIAPKLTSAEIGTSLPDWRATISTGARKFLSVDFVSK